MVADVDDVQTLSCGDRGGRNTQKFNVKGSIQLESVILIITRDPGRSQQDLVTVIITVLAAHKSSKSCMVASAVPPPPLPACMDCEARHVVRS
jgi:hypothetical protein